MLSDPLNINLDPFAVDIRNITSLITPTTTYNKQKSDEYFGSEKSAHEAWAAKVQEDKVKQAKVNTIPAAKSKPTPVSTPAALKMLLICAACSL